jgi:ankyrin repeat protein
MTHAEAKEVIEPSGLLAAARGDLPKVKAILEANPALVEAMNALTPKAGEVTPQRVAAAGRHLEILKYFISRGVQPELFMSCALGDVAMVEAYLKAHPKEVEAKGAHGIQLIVHANDAAMVELLLSMGVDPTTALPMLAWSGRVELLQVALKRGAKVNPEKVGRTALHIACAQGHAAAVTLLLDAGADINVRSKGAEWEFKTPLGLALMGGHTAAAEVLKARMPKMNAYTAALTRPTRQAAKPNFRGRR